MPLVLATYDPPADKKQLETYVVRSQTWIKEILALPGIQEWRGYRNPLGTTPQVMTIQEFDTLDACQSWLRSDDYRATIAELRSLGCTNLSMQIWDTSPFAPKPLRPGG